MDVVVNSQVQSPFVRTLESISTKGAAFTHHIPDNVPPMSQNRVAVDFGSSDGDYLNRTVSCTIPQYGYLQRVVLKYTVKITTGSQLSARHTLTPYMAYSLTNMCELKTRNRPIQTMYGREILMKAMRSDASVNRRSLVMSQAHIDSYVSNNITYKCGGITAVIGSECDFRYGKTSTSRTTSPGFFIAPDDEYTLNCYVELPLASTMSLAHCFNTRFVEPLTLTLTVGGGSDIFPCYKAVRSANTRIQKNAPKVTVQALCYFVNYHDLTEQDIRNANYRPDAPAVVKAYDTLVEPPVLVTGAGAGRESLEVSIPIRSTVFTYGMSLCASVPDRHDDQPSIVGVAIGLCNAKSFSGGIRATEIDNNGAFAVMPAYSNYTALVMYSFGGYSFSSVALQGSGQTIVNTNTVESALCDAFDHSLSTWSNKGREGTCISEVGTQAAEVVAESAQYLLHETTANGTEAPMQITWACSSGCTGGTYLNFGLSRNETYNSGGLGLQTIANPTLKLKVSSGAYSQPPYIKLANYSVAAAVADTIDARENMFYNIAEAHLLGSNELPITSTDSAAHQGAKPFLGLHGPAIAVLAIAGGAGTATLSAATRSAFTINVEGTGRVGMPQLQLYTYIHHHALVQIDSGTGAITRSIDA